MTTHALPPQLNPERPPSLGTPKQPGTPAHEWAAETATALTSEQQRAATSTSHPIQTTTNAVPVSGIATSPATTSTTGQRTPGMPGAFPGTPAAEDAGIVETARGAVESAREYLPSQEEVKETLQSAGQTVREYLPTTGVLGAVSAYLPGSPASAPTRASEHDSTHTTSLPSTELQGARAFEHVGGVGALPGTITESGVAKVPEERTAGEKGSLVQNVGAVGVTGGVAPHPNSTAVAASANDVPHGTSLPSHETGAQPNQGSRVLGAGALPGDRNEFGVAVVPNAQGTGARVGGVHEPSNTASVSASGHDGRHRPSYPTEETEGAAADSGRRVTGVGALPGSVKEEGVADVKDKDRQKAGVRAVEALATGAGVGAAAEAVKGTVPHLTSTSTNASKDPYNGFPHDVRHETSLPSTERQGALPGEYVDGVGALPGKVDEVGVARLPEEREGEVRGNVSGKPGAVPVGGRTQYPATGGAGAGAGVAGAASGATTGGVAAAQREARSGPEAMVEKGKEALGKDDGRKTKDAQPQAKRDPNQVRGEDGKYHPAQLHPPPANIANGQTDKGPGVGVDHRTGHAREGSWDDKESERSGESEGKRKVGLMGKLKGEAKVIKGKLGGKEEVVEEGRRMMGKE